MTTSETAWHVGIDYAACGSATGAKAKIARGRGARSTVKAAGYLTSFVCGTRTYAEAVAAEIRAATGVPMSVSEVATSIWPQ